MALGRSRDYKIRSISQTLAWHFWRKQKLMDEGLSKADANKQAYDELMALPQKKRIVPEEDRAEMERRRLQLIRKG